MILAGKHTMLNRTVKYPWDYRVEYLQVSTAGAYFDAGQWQRFNTNWPESRPAADSALMSGIRNGINAWLVYTFPNAKSTDQKICGNYGTFVAYPYSGRMNFGLFNSWGTAPTNANVDFVATNTKTFVFCKSVGSDQVQYGVKQGSGSWTSASWGDSTKTFNYHQHFLIFGYTEGSGGNPQTNQVYAGTRFYECGFDFDIQGGLELHLRFVPCVLDGTFYICEMNTGTMIQSAGSGSFTAGPKVADDYESYQQGGGRWLLLRRSLRACRAFAWRVAA